MTALARGENSLRGEIGADSAVRISTGIPDRNRANRADFSQIQPAHGVPIGANRDPRKELLITKILDATPELEPGSKLLRFDIVLYKG